MYNVLLVDDEVNITKSLRFSIAWETLGLTVFSEAHSGNEALELLKDHAIDIVITDIRMPGMDGLQLCKEIHTAYPKTQMIVISGYADFTYAQQCISYGVKGYCLKPVDPADLTVCLNQAVRALQESREMLQGELVESIVCGDVDALRCHLEQNHIMWKQFYTAVSVGLPCFKHLKEEPFIIKLGIHNYAYLSSSPIEFTGITGEENLLWGIGTELQPANHASLPKIISQCIVRAYQYFIEGKSGIWNQIPSDSAAQNMIHKITAALNENNLEETESLIRTIAVTERTQQSFNIKTAYFLFCTLMSNEILGKKLNLDGLNDFRQFAGEFGTFRNLLEQIQELFQVHSDTVVADANPAILSILQYIHQNFTRDISLQSISDTLHLSRSYVGQLFKKETGISYIRYLTSLRVERTKELLLQTTLSVSQVGETSGFNDYFYFIKTFKKEVGCTPSQFRNAQGSIQCAPLSDKSREGIED